MIYATVLLKVRAGYINRTVPFHNYEKSLLVRGAIYSFKIVRNILPRVAHNRTYDLTLILGDITSETEIVTLP